MRPFALVGALLRSCVGGLSRSFALRPTVFRATELGNSRDLGTIGPHGFQGKFVWTNPFCLAFKENPYGPTPRKFVRSFPQDWS